uniref:Uncharacterized protein n=1 Tax=Timema cristinae TaxID=61476 RepID=A0A7R9CU17_TIMCR|nr:unnamed protein product [Timema cristinae]
MAVPFTLAIRQLFEHNHTLVKGERERESAHLSVALSARLGNDCGSVQLVACSQGVGHVEEKGVGSLVHESTGSVPTFAWRESGKPYCGKITLSTPDRDSNLDLPVIGSLVHRESIALD